MGGRDRIEGVMLSTSVVLTLLLPPCLSLPVFPAEIISGNNTGALEFAVGSDVTIQCRVRDPTRHDVTKMRLYDEKTKKNFDVIVVGDDTIQTTLYNVSLGQNNVMVCQEGAQILTRKTWCVGYGPSQEMTVSCQLYPRERMTCSVHTDQPQDTLCNVEWSLHYRRPRSDERRPVWRPFPGIPHTLFKVPRDVSWPDVNESLFYFGHISVRATAENGIGIARASVTFVPVEYAVPGPVESLRVASSVTDPASLRLSWNHSLSVTDSVCAEMGGLSYLIEVDSPLDRGRPMMKYKADCSTKTYSSEQHFNVTGLIPNTAYTVTLTPRSPRFSGIPVSAVSTTSQSRPLKAPVIVGWSAGASPAGLAVYWKPLSHRYQGGPIVAHTISVTSTEMTSQREDYYFPVSADVVRGGGQLVTSPAVLKGCSAECDVTVTSSTVVGASAPASIRISSGLKDLDMPVIYTEKADSGNRTVSWEGSVNITSVAWCYGTSFDEDSSLIQCQTEVDEMVVERAGIRQMVIPASLLKNRHPQTDTLEMCENCQWHFAVRVTNTAYDTDMAYDSDTSSVFYSDYDGDNETDSESMDSNVNADFANDRARNASKPNFNTSLESGERVEENSVEYDPGRLVWNQCQYALDGEAPTPEVKISEAGKSDEVVVTVQSLCSRSPDSAGKPIQAELAYGDGSLQNCSALEHTEVKAISLGVYGDGTVRGQLRLSDLRRGSSYTVCVRLRSRPGWGDWHQEQFFYKTLADDRGQVIVSLLVCGLALLALFILCCLVCRIGRNLKQKSQRFSKMPDFTMDSGPGQKTDDSVAGPQYISMTMSMNKIPVSSTMAVTSTVSPHRQSLSSKDSAFEESGSGYDVGTKPPDSSLQPQRAMQGTSDPTSTARVLGQETSDDLESEVDEDDKLLDDDVAEVKKEQLPDSTRPVPGFGLDTSRPQSLQSPSSLRKNVPVSTSAPESEGWQRPEQQMENNLRIYRFCEKAKQQMGLSYGKDTKSSLRYDSEEQSLTEISKEQLNAETRYDFQYVKIDSPLRSFACCEDPRLPSNQKCPHVYPETDSETEDSSELLMIADGTCGFTCSYTPSADLKQTSSFLQQDSDSVSYSSTEDIDPQMDCYIALEHAVGEVTEDFSVPEEGDPKIPTYILEKANFNQKY